MSYATLVHPVTPEGVVWPDDKQYVLSQIEQRNDLIQSLQDTIDERDDRIAELEIEVADWQARVEDAEKRADTADEDATKAENNAQAILDTYGNILEDLERALTLHDMPIFGKSRDDEAWTLIEAIVYDLRREAAA